MTDVKKVVLAYSGGLDTSVILKWLQDTYNCEIVTFTADLGQGEEVEPARAKAQALGVKEIYIDDLREEFVRDFVFPMFRANTVYEGEYLLGTSIARPLIAKRLIEIVNETGADAICHGATGRLCSHGLATTVRFRNEFGKRKGLARNAWVTNFLYSVVDVYHRLCFRLDDHWACRLHRSGSDPS